MSEEEIRNETRMTPDELRAGILKSMASVRQIGSDEWYDYTSDVIFIFGRSLRELAIGCDRQTWPELFALMEPHAGEAGLRAEVTAAHNAFAELMLWINDPDHHPGIDDRSIFEGLARVDWKGVPIAGRVTYMAMVGLYYTARVYMAGRRYEVSGTNNKKPVFDTVADAAGLIMRMVDQGVDGVSEANHSFTAATHYALSLGLSPDDLRAALSAAVASYDANQPPDADALYRLKPLPGEPESDGKEEEGLDGYWRRFWARGRDGRYTRQPGAGDSHVQEDQGESPKD